MAKTTFMSRAWVTATLLWLLGAPMALAGDEPPAAAEHQAPSAEQTPSATESQEGSEEAKEQPDRIYPNKRCMKCHGDEDEKTEERDDGTVVNIYRDPEEFAASVHGELKCQNCHTGITKLPHQEPLPISVSCVECHQQKWEEQQGSLDPKYKRLDVVMKQIDSYMHSVHARPSRKDQSRTNATCYDCHDAHNIGTLGSDPRPSPPEEPRGLRPVPREGEGRLPDLRPRQGGDREAGQQGRRLLRLPHLPQHRLAQGRARSSC